MSTTATNTTNANTSNLKTPDVAGAIAALNTRPGPGGFWPSWLEPKMQFASTKLNNTVAVALENVSKAIIQKADVAALAAGASQKEQAVHALETATAQGINKILHSPTKAKVGEIEAILTRAQAGMTLEDFNKLDPKARAAFVKDLSPADKEAILGCVADLRQIVTRGRDALLPIAEKVGNFLNNSALSAFTDGIQAQAIKNFATSLSTTLSRFASKAAIAKDDLLARIDTVAQKALGEAEVSQKIDGAALKAEDLLARIDKNLALLASGGLSAGSGTIVIDQQLAQAMKDFIDQRIAAEKQAVETAKSDLSSSPNDKDKALALVEATEKLTKAYSAAIKVVNVAGSYLVKVSPQRDAIGSSSYPPDSSFGQCASAWKDIIDTFPTNAVTRNPALETVDMCRLVASAAIQKALTDIQDLTVTDVRDLLTPLNDYTVKCLAYRPPSTITPNQVQDYVTKILGPSQVLREKDTQAQHDKIVAAKRAAANPGGGSNVDEEAPF